MDVLPMQKPSGAHNYGDAVYLIERFQTNYMTSLNDFRDHPRNREFTYGYSGFGVSQYNDRKNLLPLPHARAEVNAISDELTALDNRNTYLNDTATEQVFRHVAPKSRILHLATHSEVSGRNPMFSSIYLSQSQQDDEERYSGRIFAYELFELKLQNDLIMLNCCESGSCSYFQGTGVVGISRALRYAGAQSLVLNLWSVNDMMASDFAVKFYEGINKGQSKPEALRNAKLHFLKTNNANPHYWGSYMLLGNESPIVKPDQTLRTIIAITFLVLFFAFAITSSVIEIRRRAKAKPRESALEGAVT
jgi:CHAT domain-containing protein